MCFSVTRRSNAGPVKRPTTGLQGSSGVQQMASGRSFGLLLTAVFLVVAGLVYWSEGRGSVYWGALAAVFFLISLMMPRVLAPLKRLWFKVGHLLHVVVSPLVLGAAYLLAFIPVGILARLFGKDLLSLKRHPAAKSYWIERAGGPASESLKDQF